MSDDANPEYDRTRRPTARMSSGFRRSAGVLLLVFLLWLLLANHVIVITGEPAFIVLGKSSWTFDDCVIIESEWLDFSLHHPILSSRLVSGDGLWLLGDGR